MMADSFVRLQDGKINLLPKGLYGFQAGEVVSY